MEVIQACRMAARSLFAEIGPWGDRCALFGGLIPGFLMPEPKTSLMPHIGTRDVNLVNRFRDAGLHETNFGKEALIFLQESFDHHEKTGPAGWAVESQFDGDERIREMREAAGIVREFVRLASNR